MLQWVGTGTYGRMRVSAGRAGRNRVQILKHTGIEMNSILKGRGSRRKYDLRTSGRGRRWGSAGRFLIAIVAFTASTELVSACSTVQRSVNAVRLEGVITVRGNVPFNAPILETEGNNFYVLVLTQPQKAALVTPGRYMVAGRLYLDDWNGRPFAHIAVSELRALEP